MSTARTADAAPKHDPVVCQYPTLSGLCPACARLWAAEMAGHSHTDVTLYDPGHCRACAEFRQRILEQVPEPQAVAQGTLL
jgi:hypothetical protein